MKKRLLTFTLLAGLTGGFVRAAPQFWKNQTPIPPKPPAVFNFDVESKSSPTATPAVMPKVSEVQLEPTPTPLPGLSPKNPTKAAIFSVVIPGAGQVYAHDPLRGVLLAGSFGFVLWRSIDNYRLHEDPKTPGQYISRNETVGSLFGLAALALYGLSVQDAYNSAQRYNRNHHLRFVFGGRNQFALNLYSF